MTYRTDDGVCGNDDLEFTVRCNIGARGYRGHRPECNPRWLLARQVEAPAGRVLSLEDFQLLFSLGTSRWTPRGWDPKRLALLERSSKRL